MPEKSLEARLLERTTDQALALIATEIDNLYRSDTDILTEITEMVVLRQKMQKEIDAINELKSSDGAIKL